MEEEEAGGAGNLLLLEAATVSLKKVNIFVEIFSLEEFSKVPRNPLKQL